MTAHLTRLVVNRLAVTRVMAIATAVLWTGIDARASEASGGADGRFEIAQADQRNRRDDGQQRRREGGGGGERREMPRSEPRREQFQRSEPRREQFQRSEPRREQFQPRREPVQRVEPRREPVQRVEPRREQFQRGEPRREPVQRVEPRRDQIQRPAQSLPRPGQPPQGAPPTSVPRVGTPVTRPPTGAGEGTRTGAPRPLPEGPATRGFAGPQRPGTTVPPADNAGRGGRDDDGERRRARGGRDDDGERRPRGGSDDDSERRRARGGGDDRTRTGVPNQLPEGGATRGFAGPRTPGTSVPPVNNATGGGGDDGRRARNIGGVGDPRRVRSIGEIQNRRVVAPVAGGGKTQVYREPGNRMIMTTGNRRFIQHNESRRFFGSDGGRRLGFSRQVRQDGSSIASIRRRHGTVYSEFDREGRLVRRYRRGAGGRDYVLIDNRRYWRRGVGIALGVGAVAAAAILLAPIARADRYRGYIVEYDDASYDDLYYSLSAPPVEPLPRRYSLVEVLNSYSLRERMRRVDIDSIYFETGSWELDPGQYRKLRLLARTLLRVIEENPDEVFLIEGHTDAEGPALDNLSLSDRRAEAVAQVLSEEFNVPPENLVTQGYGEEYLRVRIDGPARVNRRVTVRRITPLLNQGEIASEPPLPDGPPLAEAPPLPEEQPGEGYAPDGPPPPDGYAPDGPPPGEYVPEGVPN